MHKDFVYLSDIAPSIQRAVRYFDPYFNFVGERVTGYNAPEIVLTREAAEKLIQVQNDLSAQDLELVVYDAYRPVKAVNHFWHWAQTECDKTKNLYYPRITKKECFEQGFIAKRSAHSRGSTVDLTVIERGQKVCPPDQAQQLRRTLVDGTEFIYLDDKTIDMFAGFDMLDKSAHHDSDLIPLKNLENRNILKDVMVKNDFKPYQYEWWHYTLDNEPFPDTYFDFDIDPK